MSKSTPPIPSTDLRGSAFDSISALLTSGGDERMLLDPATGLNPYGCAPCPHEDVVELGSCTTSWTSQLAFEAAERTLQRLARSSPRAALTTAVDCACESLRAELLAVLEIDDVPGLQMVLTPSGTDAELVPLVLAAGRTPGRICNIVVGPGEAGSGTALAAGGQHPNELTPLGEPGSRASIDGSLSERVRVGTVALRAEGGELRPAEDVDDEVERLVETAIRAGEMVIVHRIAHSKTGVFAPQLRCLRRLVDRHGSRVIVVVDAAQGRIGSATLRHHLSSGDIVLLTGSKFYGGPPFSGAVLVPGSRCPSATCAAPPEGLFDYLSASDLPPSWDGWRSRCKRHNNLGLLLRWRAALSEMRAYRSIPRSIQQEIIAEFGESVRSRLTRAHGVSPIDAPRPDAPRCAFDAEPQESMPTVFSFALHRREGGGQRSLGATALKEIARRLGANAFSLSQGDVSPGLLEALSPRFHVGQPVRLGAAGGDAPAALRVAIGAPLVREVASNPARGNRLSDRTRWLDTRIAALCAKLEALLEGMKGDRS